MARKGTQLRREEFITRGDCGYVKETTVPIARSRTNFEIDALHQKRTGRGHGFSFGANQFDVLVKNP